MLSNIRIVLVETTHPGNIGAVARAMKNMCLNDLHLVAPATFPSADATSRASGADDILCSATVSDTLEEAIADCSWVIGASARSRAIRWPELSPRECAEWVKRKASGQKIAVLFGREHSGLKNSEMDRCHYLLRIPCNENFSSLNVAAAVQVMAYEFLLAAREESAGAESEGDRLLATTAQRESFYAHLQQTLADLGFLHPDKSRSLMRRLRRIFNRADLDVKELDILRGILSAAQGRKLGVKAAHSEK